MRTTLNIWGLVLIAIFGFLFLASCTGKIEDTYPRREGGEVIPYPTKKERETVFGPGGLNIFGTGSKKDTATTGTGIGVNSFLWRASLDTLSFLPLSSADPFGGVIITDWYTPPEAPEERFKLTVYILDRRLRADGVKISVFRQRKFVSTGVDWRTVTINPDTATQLENAILTRARQLRVENVE